MKIIAELPKGTQKQLHRDLMRQMYVDTEFVCHIADSYGVDRNETLDLYMYLQKRYCEKEDLNNINLKAVKFATDIASKLFKKRGAE